MSKHNSHGRNDHKHSTYKPSEFKRCYMSHPPLKIGEHVIYGGSCIDPVVQDADVYVGFDLGMAKSPMSYPWEKGESFLFHIQDMGVPKDPDQFKKLIEWLAVQLAAKKKVHLGCIGGHGRTGMVLSALVAHMTGEKDAIQYVRKHYCEKAVESAVQVKFLMDHFGVSHAKGHKEYASHSGYHGDWNGSDRQADYDYYYGGSRTTKTKPAPAPTPVLTAQKKSPTLIWGSAVTIDKLLESVTI